MKYKSTRDISKAIFESAEVIKKGLADDGGLFVPDSIPTLTNNDIQALLPLDYINRAAYVLSLFLTDYSKDALLEDCKAAYSSKAFPNGAAPLVNIHDNVYSLELWHGPTAAFKDMALQLMPHLLVRALRKTGENKTALILVATSGDTGKAALEGYCDIDGIKIMVFYPDDGVSRVQKLQMATQSGSNVNVCAIKGNFDDAQNGVKRIFSDNEFAKELEAAGYFLSSANSINWGRLAPQIVYYVSAYCDLVKLGKLAPGEKFNVCVPTGNFGNIFAAYIAKLMGLPIGKLICASNVNNILTDFLASGTYNRNRKFHVTMSPSMDILISSNLERLLYFVAGAEKTKKYMESLASTGSYTISAEEKAEIDKSFIGYYTDEKSTADTINFNFNEYGYLHDTHTAVALNAAKRFIEETGDASPMIVDSTASPYKFAQDVLTSLGGGDAESLEALSRLSKLTQTDIPYPLRNIADKKVRFSNVISSADMKKSVKSFVGLD